ncbi:membrane protein [Streptomyces sp. Tu 6176]|uniref:hypothetical protein n=1 Tax=Streptomyces sp. Tu 6176 TaxID=1470557 RepID=UPI00044EC07B|nr:hypothetical protein [Streptomyces sp. Tu 6176]EYT79995.1 membrane protein [Streptomyces sp. Tu 6176]
MTAPHSRAASAGRDLRLLRAAVFAAVCVVLAAAGHTLGSCATVPLWTLGAGFLGALVVVVPLAGRARSLPGIAALLAAGQLVLHALFGLGQHGAGMVSGAIPMGSMGSMGAMGSLGSAASPGAAGSTMPGGSLGHPGHVLSDAALVERAARYLCGTTTAGITPARAYRILVDAHVYPSGAAAPTGATGPAAAPHGAGSLAALLPSLPMLLGHVLAALAAGWLLRRGDLALVRLIALSAHGVAEGALVRSLRGALALVCALCAGLPALPSTGPRFPRAADRVLPPPTATALQHTVIRRGPPAAVLVLAA